MARLRDERGGQGREGRKEGTKEEKKRKSESMGGEKERKEVTS